MNPTPGVKFLTCIGIIQLVCKSFLGPSFPVQTSINEGSREFSLVSSLAVVGLGPFDIKVIIAKKTENTIDTVGYILIAIHPEPRSQHSSHITVLVDDLAAHSEYPEILARCFLDALRSAYRGIPCPISPVCLLSLHLRKSLWAPVRRFRYSCCKTGYLHALQG